jgi:hypothetical protein
MAGLSIRFMNAGQDRLVHTISVSRGLSKAPGKVPPVLFPQGNIKRGKVPIVSKNVVKNLHKGATAEVLFTDTFQTADIAFKYGQAFVDYRSRYGWVYPISSRKLVGLAFSTFCANHFTPVILIKDNVGENIGGDLIEECLRLSVKSAFICPHTPQQDHAEGYLGRVTRMASFAMVYSGSPLFTWRWATIAATFINNITACWHSEEQLWAQPHQLVHGEPLADSSIVMPWGCAVLVMLTPDELGKFKSRCALIIFENFCSLRCSTPLVHLRGLLPTNETACLPPRLHVLDECVSDAERQNCSRCKSRWRFATSMCSCAFTTQHASAIAI